MSTTHEDFLIWLRTLMFSSEGRLGRLSYFSYYVAFLFLCFLLGFIAATIFPYLLIPFMLAVIYAAYILAIKRLHDLGLSGRFILLGFVPIVSAFFGLALLFVPGQKKVNKYGPRDGDKKNIYFHSGQDFTRNRVLMLLGSILGSIVIAYLFRVYSPY